MPLKLEPALMNQLPANFVILRVLTAERCKPKRPNGFSTFLGFDSSEMAKELVINLKLAMKKQVLPQTA